MEESDIIDQYLRGELDNEQSQSFSKQLHSNSDLQKKVALRKLVIVGISQAYAEELKTKLADFDRSLEDKKRFQFSWKMAAAFAAMVVTVSIVYFSIQKPNPYDFDMVEIGLPNVMGVTDDIALNNAMSIFKAEDYVVSGKGFNDLLTNNPKNDTLLYFSGLCDFRTKQAGKAIMKWNEIDAQSIFFEKAQYRLAIAYWTEKNKVKAIELIQQMENSENELLQKEAKRALSALR